MRRMLDATAGMVSAAAEEKGISPYPIFSLVDKLTQAGKLEEKQIYGAVLQALGDCSSQTEVEQRTLQLLGLGAEQTHDDGLRELFVRGMRLREKPTKDPWLWELPAVRALAGEGISFPKPVTFLVGENGAGKSTLIEALVVAAGFNAEGGSRNFNFATVNAHSALHAFVTVLRGAYRPADGFFLRAESFFNVATTVDDLDGGDGFIERFGGISLHERSHGESFLALVQNRFWGNGLYILDEPEAALSPMKQIALLREIKRLADEGSQFIVATHSPILMACPHAAILLLEENGIHAVRYRDTDHFTVTRRFFDDPEGFLEKMLGAAD